MACKILRAIFLCSTFVARTGSALIFINYTPSSLKSASRIDASQDLDSSVHMIRSGFLSAIDRKEMLGCVKSQTEEHGIARRANALLLLDDGKSCAQVAEALYLDDDTVRCWYKQYQTGGWDFVVINDWQGGQPRMTVQQETALTAWLEDRFCRSADEIRAHIAREFGLPYFHSGCIKLDLPPERSLTLM